MTLTREPSGETGQHPAPSAAMPTGVLVVLLVIVAAAVLRRPLHGTLDHPTLQSAATIFIAVAVQALPFLVLGTVLSGAVAAFVPADAVGRALPDNALAVPLAGTAGVALPGCECGAVPLAGRLVQKGAPAGAALAFLLSAPAINPVVLVATSVAFPGHPEFVLARALASWLTAVVVGLIWTRYGNEMWMARARRPAVDDGTGRWDTFTATVLHDFGHAGGFLVVGALGAAVLRSVVPAHVLDSVAGSGIGAVLAMAVLAVVLAVCSEADAFVASGLTQFSLTSRLVFLVVGPAVDIKLVAMQAGVFGRSFASRFAPLTFAVAIGSAVLVGWLLL